MAVLVTGGSGFIGSHTLLQLLNAGHQVRTTVRDLKREPEVRAMLKQGGVEPGDRLQIFAADLNSDAARPAAGGERFLATAGDFMLIRDIAKVLKQRMGAAGHKVPTRQLPNWLIRVAALRDPAVKQILP